uniref:CFA20 domain-containing protein n=1 Tax=Oryzias latipes TaxID=8090 RepID=A0A3B3IAN7_ORYLA
MTFWLRLTTQGNRVSQISAGMFFCLYAVGSHLFDNWQKEVDKHVVASLMCFQTPPSCSTTNISCPADPIKTPGIKSPFLVFILKTTELFSFEVQVRNVCRWLKWSTSQKKNKVDHFRATFILDMGERWGKEIFNLAEFTSSSFGSRYVETLEGIVWIRRVYFTDGEYSEDEIFNDF